ncbi:ATP-binding protein [Asanoa ishikariensis]|uniref:AAA+ ATPase domain-containing protein n=1 Tax=Asanoa ishikariensis TaxID=137265 RepID=A0A1H3MNW3_9ACTN|nr:ATP-binding protein [Asanoa ishikariensis]SDY77789.1 hypothetical protein SAMN05421684_1499 [Asanoa ishikariensis]
MSTFRASAASVLRQATTGVLVNAITDHIGMRVSPAEHKAWTNSLGALAQDLNDAGLAQVEMLCEYQLPLTSRRVDAVLAGVHPRTGADSYVVIELKQWSWAKAADDSAHLVMVRHMSEPQLHPGVQVADYCDYLTGFLGVLAQTPDAVRGAAYLHNAADDDVRDLFALPPTERSRVFTQQRRGEFLEYLQTHLAPASGAGAADRFLTSAVRPSRLLLQHAAEEIQQRSHFTLLDEQHVAYELVMRAVERARVANSKRVVVVEGGPGSGKSVIALSIMGELARQGRAVVHATGSRSFTQTLRKYAGRGSTHHQKLFKYFNSFMAATPNDLDVLLCDEAHRVRETSANRWTSRALRAGRPQVDELMAAARVPVFLLDEHQVVRPGEQGTIDVISAHAEQLGIKVDLVSLHDQFRCGGSQAYEEWVLALLGLEGEKPHVWEGDGRFDLRVAASPAEMEAFLAEQNARGLTARMSAGYCWRWSKPQPDDSLVDDVRIGDWARPWNANSERNVGGAPGSAFWATDPAGFGQVGCVYTAQGFEYEWSGVILGPDLVARDGRLTTVPSASKDPALTKGTDADRLIRNTYKVLLTRGMRGTLIYSTDAETREYFAGLVRTVRSADVRYASGVQSPRLVASTKDCQAVRLKVRTGPVLSFESRTPISLSSVAHSTHPPLAPL